MLKCFKAALFIMVKNWKEPSPLTDCINELMYIRTILLTNKTRSYYLTLLISSFEIDTSNMCSKNIRTIVASCGRHEELV